jgi:peptide-methionine (R)-S-oxide reductase
MERELKAAIRKLASVISVSSVAKIVLMALIPLCLLTYLLAMPSKPIATDKADKAEKPSVIMTKPSDEELRKRLSPEQYYVTQEKGTERAFTGKYWNHHEAGAYKCIVCGAELFTSGSKFDSGCGWPSFDRAVSDKVIDTGTDTSHGMVRDEIVCHNCGAHLGHVFNDGPTATGLRYCVNSASIDFQAKDEAKNKK